MAVIFVFGMIAFLILTQRKQNRKYREHLKALVAEKERTMSMISVEIHDNVCQVLNVARMNVHWLHNSAPPEHKGRVEKIGQMLDTVILDTNNISHTLNSDFLKKKGLIQSLKVESEWVNNSKKIKCELTISGITERFGDDIEITLFRIAQEAINNTIKHANATYIHVALVYNTEDFSMTITDNGKGFDLTASKYMDGLGKTSMLTRAKIVGGELSIESTIGKGTIISVTVPCSSLKTVVAESTAEDLMELSEMSVP